MKNKDNTILILKILNISHLRAGKRLIVIIGIQNKSLYLHNVHNTFLIIKTYTNTSIKKIYII